MHRGPVRELEAGTAAGVGSGIEQPGQLGVIQPVRQRPGQLQLLGGFEQLLDGADADLGAEADLAEGEPGL